MTPVAYLTRYRLNQAKNSLTDTNRPITDIALAVGFSGQRLLQPRVPPRSGRLTGSVSARQLTRLCTPPGIC